MPWKYTDEYYREYTRTTWDESAEGYRDWMPLLAPFRAALVDRLNPRSGEVILDLGTGPGEPGLTIARKVGPSGRVVGVDLSERMVEVARQTAARQGIPNIEFRAMDCGKLAFEDRTFDAAVSAFGFQIFTDPEAAAREAHRVLKPRGRLVVTIWGTGDRVPFLDVIIAPMLRHAEPDETGYLPTPYETGGPGEMVRFLEAAGFGTVREHRFSHTITVPDPEAYLRGVLRGTPIGHSLGEESEAVQREVLQATRENLERWRTPTGLALPAECVLVDARK